MLLSKSWLNNVASLCLARVNSVIVSVVVIVAVVVAVSFTSCDDAIIESPVPAGRVHYSCNIGIINDVMGRDKGQADLDCPGGYVRIYDKQKLMATDEVGTGGLLLLHNFENTGFYAFDLTCPYCYKVGGSPAEKMHRLTISQEFFNKAQCNVCGSEFGSVFYGSPAPSAGPANEHNYILRKYNAYAVGENLVVTR